jgi:hypothetical protein
MYQSASAEPVPLRVIRSTPIREDTGRVCGLELLLDEVRAQFEGKAISGRGVLLCIRSVVVGNYDRGFRREILAHQFPPWGNGAEHPEAGRNMKAPRKCRAFHNDRTL